MLESQNGGVEARHTSSQIVISGLFQLVSYVKFKVKAGSGGVVLGPMKYFPPVFFVELTILHTLEVLDLLESQKWRSGGQTYKFSNRNIRSLSASELCQIQG